MPGQDGPACTVDCYFDSNSGSGNDECYWNHACDPHEIAPDYYPEPENGAACKYDEGANTPGTSATCAELYATQLPTCFDFCGPLTPNGCDCFGCCELPADGGKYVFLGSEDDADVGTCDLTVLDDPTKCHPCLPVAACLNTCGKCELCIGKTDVPPECYPPDGGVPDGGLDASVPDGGWPDGSAPDGGTIPGQCFEGVQACGLPGQGPCPINFYCITGCCKQVPN